MEKEQGSVGMKKRVQKASVFIIGVILIGLSILLWVFLTREKDGVKEVKIEDFRTELFGDNVYIFSPKDSPEKIQKVLDDTYKQQESNQFGSERYAFYFLPGEYDDSLKVNVGYYMQVGGLGILPTDTVIPELQCYARWLGDDSNHNATCNFWRGIENLTIEKNVVWAVSQATSMRRMNLQGSLRLHDNFGWASGGFLSDSLIAGLTDSGSQQQWLSRNTDWKGWMGQNWNMVFVGIEDGKAPKGTWPGTKYTSVDQTPIVREKPYLVNDAKKGYGVFVPEIRENSSGISWKDGAKGEFIDISKFYIAKSESDNSDTINKALQDGKHLILTPGIYKLDKPIKVEKENTVVLGLGLATLVAENGNSCMETADVDGLKISGLLFDAGAVESEYLMQVGYEKRDKSHKQNPISLSDLYFRVGGADSKPSKTKSCVIIQSNDVIGDNFWVWRADHGDEVAWNKNTAANGIIINGDNATFYALLVEHFQEYQTIWNGNNGRTYFYQCEIPYDVPNQQSWMSHDGTKNGYSSYKVGEDVTSHEAWGLGIYSFNRDAVVDLESAMEVPDHKGVKIHNICTVMITGNPGISHIINDSGKPAIRSGAREIIKEYENGISN